MQAGFPEGRGGVGEPKKYRNLPTIRLVVLFLLFVPAAVLASPPESSKASNPLSGQVPSSILFLGDQKPSYALVVDKSQQKLYLYQQEEAGPRLIRTFNCATGENAGQKKTRGDKRTPEGVYFFTRWIEYKNLGSIYGIRAFPMDYPNLFDRREDHRGDGIWLHGTDKPLTPTSTNGCIVLENEDVAEISKYIRLKQTPIIIREKIQTVSLEEIQRERNRFLDFLKDWKQAWESKNLDRYMSLHSRKFYCRNLDWEGWKNYKARLNQQYRTIQVIIENPMILKHKENVLIVFYQRYQSDKFRNEGTKRLYLIPEEGNYRIIGEEWDERRGGEIAPDIPPMVLASFVTPKAPGPMAKTQLAQNAEKRESPKPAAPAAPAAGLTSSKPAASPSPKAAEVRRGAIEKAPTVDLAEIKVFLNAWKSAWEKKDLNRYMDFYSKNFRSQGKGWDQWRQQKKSLNERYRQIQVTLEDIQAKRVGDQIVVSFRQTYRSDSLKSTGLKSLTLRQEGPSWKILREDFARTRGAQRV